MGDVTSGDITKSASKKIDQLRLQVNRFAGPYAPARFRLLESSFPYTGPLDMSLAIAAAVIYDRRWKDAAKADPRNAQEYLGRSLLALAGPLQFVLENLDEVIQTIVIYADANDVPMPKDAPAAQIPMPILLGAAALLAYIIFKE
jgi:hypothetical protein